MILCPVQTRLFVKSGQGNANACSPRPKTALPKTVMNCLCGNVNSNSIRSVGTLSSSLYYRITASTSSTVSLIVSQVCSAVVCLDHHLAEFAQHS